MKISNNRFSPLGFGAKKEVMKEVKAACDDLTRKNFAPKAYAPIDMSNKADIDKYLVVKGMSMHCNAFLRLEVESQKGGKAFTIMDMGPVSKVDKTIAQKETMERIEDAVDNLSKAVDKVDEHNPYED